MCILGFGRYFTSGSRRYPLLVAAALGWVLVHLRRLLLLSFWLAVPPAIKIFISSVTSIIGISDLLHHKGVYRHKISSGMPTNHS